MAAAPGIFRGATICGGAKSGKSRFAQNLAESLPGPRLMWRRESPWMKRCRPASPGIKQDREPEWQTREEPLALAPVLRETDGRYGVILVDCLTMWLANLMGRGEGDLAEERQRLVEVLDVMTPPVILVSNELGWGIVPDNPLARRFRDVAGGLHHEIAALAGVAVLVVSGLPVYLKGKEILSNAKE